MLSSAHDIESFGNLESKQQHLLSKISTLNHLIKSSLILLTVPAVQPVQKSQFPMCIEHSSMQRSSHPRWVIANVKQGKDLRRTRAKEFALFNSNCVCVCVGGNIL